MTQQSPREKKARSEAATSAEVQWWDGKLDGLLECQQRIIELMPQYVKDCDRIYIIFVKHTSLVTKITGPTQPNWLLEQLRDFHRAATSSRLGWILHPTNPRRYLLRHQELSSVNPFQYILCIYIFDSE